MGSIFLRDSRPCGQVSKLKVRFKSGKLVEGTRPCGHDLNYASGRYLVRCSMISTRSGKYCSWNRTFYGRYSSSSSKDLNCQADQVTKPNLGLKAFIFSQNTLSFGQNTLSFVKTLSFFRPWVLSVLHKEKACVHTSSVRPHIYGHACVYRAITSSKCLVCHYYWLSRAPKPNHKRRRWKFLKFRSVAFSNLMHQQPRLSPKLRIRTIL